MSKKDMKFTSMSALDNVQRVIDDANDAIRNPMSGIKESAISEVLGGALGAGLGGGISFAALYGLGTVGLSAAGITSGLAAAGALVGGGMAAGVLVLAAPVAAIGGAGVWIVAKRNQKRLLQRKERVLNDAIRARDAIVKALEKEVSDNKDRIDRLNALNILLQRAVNDLQSDLAA